MKANLAPIHMQFDCLVAGRVIAVNSTTPPRRPKQVVKRDKTIMVTDEQNPWLLDSIGTSTVIGIRDPELIGVTIFAFACVSERCGA